MKTLKFIFSGIVLVGLMSCNNLSKKELKNNNTPHSDTQIDTLSSKLFSDIDTLLKKYNTPGVCITIIDNSTVIYTKGFGSRSNKEKLPINSNTLFQSASIGKSITAYTVMKLAQDGLVDLDKDVNYILKNWEIQENEFTRKDKTTLRRLLSHTAGINVHGFSGYKPSDKLPTLTQVLEGVSPANNEPIRVVREPGIQFDYSSGGYMIIQKVLEDRFEKSFDKIVSETLFQPLNMESAYYSTTFPDTKNNVAYAHNKQGEMETYGKGHNFVEYGAGGGLWINSYDLAKFAIEIIKTNNGNSNQLLSQKSMKEMFEKPQVSNDEIRINADYYGLGFFIIAKGREAFHGGSNDPGFEHIFYLLPKKGKGAIILTNGYNGDRLYQEIIIRIVKEFRWNE